jgi:hypothetical protein
MSRRFNLVGALLGQRGTGKTLFVLGSKYSAKPEDKKLAVRGLIDIPLSNKMKVLIILTVDHPAYRHIPLLNQKDYFRFKSGIARIIIKPRQANELFDLIGDEQRSAHMNNTFIICEDAKKYTGKNLSPTLEGLIIDSKQRNIDMIFMYHCFVDTPGDLFTKMDFVQLFKVEDNPEVRRGKISKFNKFIAAYEEVSRHPSQFHSVFIDTRND